MKSMNTQYDEVLVTCSPEYIKRTQAVFKLMYERNLAYKAESEVDWCTSCETTLAREQVQGGKCERCGYDKNISAFDFHHRDPKNKDSQLDMRHLSNSNMNWIIEEFEKCDVLCSNCHREIHNPDLVLKDMEEKLKVVNESVISIKKEKSELIRLAIERDLIVTGSSDYHGTGKLNGLGENTTPESQWIRLESMAGERRVIS